MDFYDILLAKKLGGGGSSVTVESLNVTENGTYQEEGKAYSPVVVDVPVGFTTEQIADRTAPIGELDLTSMSVFYGDYGFYNFLGITGVIGLSIFHSSEFYGCTGIVHINIQVKNSGGDAMNNCFQKCTGLEIAVVNFLGTTAPTGLFNGCSNLEKADISNASTGGYIRTNWFANCAKLTTLVLRKSSVLSLENTASLNGTPFASGGTGGTLYVPSALISSYESATNWSTILGYANNQILPIEGSIYETQYADGTAIE